MRRKQRFWTLQTKLPIAAAGLLLALAMALTYVSDLEVRRQAREIAAARLVNLRERLILSFGQATPRALARLDQVAQQSAITGALTQAGADPAEARRSLAEIQRSGSGSGSIALWDLDRHLVAVGGIKGDSARWFGPPTPVDSAAVTAIQVAGDSLLYYDLVAPVRVQRRVVGFIQRRDVVATSAATRESMVDLVGPEGRVLFGTPGGVWTDLAGIAEAPSSTTFDAPEPVAYQRNQEWQLGLGGTVPGTPWIVVAEVPLRAALAATGGFLPRLAVIALALVAVATIAAAMLGRSITQPLQSLRDAADGIRTGRRNLRAAVAEQPELAVVAQAFNAMADENDRHLKALAANEQRFRSLVTATAQIVFWTDPEGKITEPLPSYQAFTGVDVEQLLREGCLTALHPDDVANTNIAWSEAVKHRSLFETEYRLRRHDGVYRWFVVRAVPILASEGVIREWVGTCTDTTRQREAEENLHRKEEELKQSQRLDAIGRLAGGVAHDFNNLLTAIVVPAELAARRLPPDHPVLEDLDEIRVAGLRAAELTKQLLAFGRQQVLSPVVVSLGDVIDSSSRLLKRVIPESVRMDFVNTAAAGRVKVDRTQLEQVIINLAVNARDAMPDGGQLTIESESINLDEEFCSRHEGITPGRYVMLAVTDTGIGMDEQTRGQIFEPFFTTKSASKGTGLGLSTVYGIVRQSGGHIWVYSEPGRGTTVKAYFPEATGDATPVHDPVQKIDTPTGTSTILMAEDEPALRKLGNRVLRSLGYEVLLAADGDEALALATSHPGKIDLLLSDVVMPGMNGVELWERLRQIRPGIPVLFLSGWASDAVVRHRILEGDAPFLQKPFTADQLGRKVDEVIQGGLVRTN
jgi:PAS domain S-box-containing protein